MSYKCDKCSAIRNGKELVRVDEIRNVNYNRVFNRKNRRDKSVDVLVDSVYTGTEYVKVSRLCERCYEYYTDIPTKVSNNVKEVKFFGKRKQSRVEEPSEDEKDMPDFKGLRERFERGA
jgi:hypothetical protein